jgi:hypothetical protein
MKWSRHTHTEYTEYFVDDIIYLPTEGKLLCIESEYVFITKPSDSKSEWYVQQGPLKMKNIPVEPGRSWGPYTSLRAAKAAYIMLRATHHDK